MNVMHFIFITIKNLREFRFINIELNTKVLTQRKKG